MAGGPALVAVLTALIASSENASERAAREPAGRIYETPTGVTAAFDTMEVVLASVGEDGKVVLSCVDSQESVRRFFEAPPARVQSTAPKEK